MKSYIGSRDVIMIDEDRERVYWMAIGAPELDPLDPNVWRCELRMTWAATGLTRPGEDEPFIATGADPVAAIQAALDMSEAAVYIFRAQGRRFFYRHYGEKGSEWIPTAPGPALKQFLAQAVEHA